MRKESDVPHDPNHLALKGTLMYCGARGFSSGMGEGKCSSIIARRILKALRSMGWIERTGT